MQYRNYSVKVTNGSNIVIGNTGVDFFRNNVSAGCAFKIQDESVVYTISSVVPPVLDYSASTGYITGQHVRYSNGSIYRAIRSVPAGGDPSNTFYWVVVSATDLPILYLSAPYSGASKESALYQITRDFTPNFGFAEINIGDQDWPVHLTQETIRKIDTVLAQLKARIDAHGIA